MPLKPVDSVNPSARVEGEVTSSVSPSDAFGIERFIGILAGKTDKVATIEEMNEAAAEGWARCGGLSEGIPLEDE